MKQMGKLSPEERPVMGQLANDVRAALEEALEAKGKELEAKALEDRLKAEALDITIPGKAPKLAIVGNEGATRRVVAAIGRSYDEMSKASKSPRAGMGAPSRAF